MSKGALKEMLRASIDRFLLLTQDIPDLDKAVIIKDYQARINVLGATDNG